MLSPDLCLGLPSSPFPSDFPIKNFDAFLIYPMHATWFIQLILPDLITIKIFDEVYKS